MDDQRVGSVLRALRIRRGLRQVDVARLAGVDQSQVSRLERGRLEEVGLATARRIARVLDAKLEVVLGWRGSELDRLLDRDHATMVERVAASLRRGGWTVLLEYAFNHFGERGSVDVLAWQPEHQALLLVEVKSRIVDLQAMFASQARKVRIVPRLVAADQGWPPLHIGRLLVVADTTANRRVVADHEASFATAHPARTRAIRAWLAAPTKDLGGVWFVSYMRPAHGMRFTGGIRRVRRSRAGPSPPSRLTTDATTSSTVDPSLGVPPGTAS